MKSQTFFSEITGDWIAQKSIYFLKNNNKKHLEENFKIDFRNQDKLRFEFIKKSSNKVNYEVDYSNNIISKENDQFVVNYKSVEISKNIFEISFKISDQNLIYKEYICLINPYLIVSICFIRSYYKYLSITFNSYIKKILKT